LKSKLGFFFLFLSLSIFSQDRLELNYSLRNTTVPTLSFYVSPFPKEEIIFALDQGFQSRFSVELKIKEKQEGFFGLFGDKTHDEFNVFLIAEFNPFTDEYNIETYTGGQLAFSGEAIFLSTFGRINGVRLDNLPEGIPLEKLYVEAVGFVTPIQWVMPMGIMDFFSTDYKYRTPPIKIPLVPEANEEGRGE
jgi:hypothetical protein